MKKKKQVICSEDLCVAKVQILVQKNYLNSPLILLLCRTYVSDNSPH